MTHNNELPGDETFAARLFGWPPASGDDDGELASLHARLADAAAGDGLLDVVYATLDSPVGSLLLASTPVGLVRVAFANQGHEAVLAELARVISPRILRAPARLDDVARELDEYFAGRRQSFDLPLDLRLAGGFRREVLEHLPEIGYGHTASYTAAATAAGRPRAVRAAATACARNPLPVVLPCHRVIRADGLMGRYTGGEPAKKALLDLEAAA